MKSYFQQMRMLENGNRLIFTTELEKSKNEKTLSFLHASSFISSNFNISHHSYPFCHVFEEIRSCFWLKWVVRMNVSVSILSHVSGHILWIELFLFGESLVYLTSFSCRSVVQLVAFWIKCLFSSVLVNKNTSEMFHSQLPHGISESIYLEFPISNKMSFVILSE